MWDDFTCNCIESNEVKGLKQRIMIFLILICVLVLVLDAKIVQESAQEAIELCIKTVIPALFPFFLVTYLLVNCLLNSSSTRPGLLGKVFCMPVSVERLPVIGILGGYPTGAIAIHQAWKCGAIADADARRMLCFCNNAGPALIFGICSAYFSSIWYGVAIWLIQILSAAFIGLLLRAPVRLKKQYHNISSNLSITGAMEKGLRSICSVCGWVILFRVIISVIDRWIPNSMDSQWHIMLAGVMELSNGCTQLGSVHPIGMRFILATAFLSFGGFCVTMQTASAVKDLGLGSYLHWKLAQSIFAVFLSTVLQPFVFSKQERVPNFIWIAAISGITIILIVTIAVILKKTVAFRDKSVYNPIRIQKSEEMSHAFPKENGKILQLLLPQHKVG